MRVERRATLLLILLSVLASVLVVGLAVQNRAKTSAQYFAETGHTVREPFLSTFEEQGGIALFGYPLTDAYENEDGTLVQTFQRAHLQLTTRGVGLAPIGEALHLGDAASGAGVDPAFREFYRSEGGESFFGLPLGAAREENGVLIQDFQRVRIVRDGLGQVRLADLGSIYVAAFPPPDIPGYAAIRLRGTPTPPPELRARVSIEHPTVVPGGEQIIYLYVEDAEGRSIGGAQALAVLRYDRAAAEVELGSTDAHGLSSARFIAPPATPGSRVLVEVHVLLGEIFLTVETAYMQWW
jgi:hypothetical protein